MRYLIRLPLAAALATLAAVPCARAADHDDTPELKEMVRHDSRLTDLHVFTRGNDLVITLASNPTIPPSATAYFTGRVEAHDSGGTIPYENFIQRFKVTLHRRGDRWLIHDYEVADPGGGPWNEGRTGFR